MRRNGLERESPSSDVSNDDDDDELHSYEIFYELLLFNQTPPPFDNFDIPAAHVAAFQWNMSHDSKWPNPLRFKYIIDQNQRPIHSSTEWWFQLGLWIYLSTILALYYIIPQIGCTQIHCVYVPCPLIHDSLASRDIILVMPAGICLSFTRKKT